MSELPILITNPKYFIWSCNDTGQ